MLSYIKYNLWLFIMAWSSEVLMSIYFPGRLANPYIWLPIQIYHHFDIIWVILICHFILLVVSFKFITIVKEPCTLTIRLIFGESSKVECSIWKHPFALNYLILVPFTN